ncbi:MAG: DUF1624 domain-containing protein, partial [Methylobacteriaceae bacterium]|nr:DUF1624 domain-containing protein [Methylobacteriaceae bacterium]
GWNLFARAIAGAFLILSGLGLALAHRHGWHLARFARRLLAIVLAAGLVTAGTAIAFPDAYVFFGILHNIAASSVLALPFTRLPAPAAAIGALAFGVAPFLTGFVPLLDHPGLAFIGLSSRVPLTNDYVPLVPWTGFVLAGVALGRWGLVQPPDAGRSGAPASRAIGALSFLGRRSLLIYLAHQPLIYGALAAYVAVAGPSRTAEERPFIASCEASCAHSGATAATCRATCACTVAQIRSASLWAPLAANRLTPEEFERVTGIARLCLAQHRDRP